MRAHTAIAEQCAEILHGSAYRCTFPTLLGGTALAVLFTATAPILLAQGQIQTSQGAVRSFPEPDFVLRGKQAKPERTRVVLGPTHSDAKGGSTGTFAVYGALRIEVSTIALSGDGRVLAVGYTPGFVDLWNIEKRERFRTLEGGGTVALTRDGNLLANNGDGIELINVLTGKLERRIPRPHRFPDNTIQQFDFNLAGTLLHITANSEDDSIYDLSTGKVAATLPNTRRARFSADGSLLVGENNDHLIVWNTKDWAELQEFPNGPGYATSIAVSPDSTLVMAGTSKVGRLLRLDSAVEVARISGGYTSFGAFDDAGFLLVLAHEGLAVFDRQGNKLCANPNFGSPALALSSDGLSFAAALPSAGATVAVWNLQKALQACGVPVSPSSPH